MRIEPRSQSNQRCLAWMAKKVLVNARRMLKGESIPREKSHKERSAAFSQEMENE